jgi:hypothetical protein
VAIEPELDADRFDLRITNRRVVNPCYQAVSRQLLADQEEFFIKRAIWV